MQSNISYIGAWSDRDLIAEAQSATGEQYSWCAREIESRLRLRNALFTRCLALQQRANNEEQRGFQQSAAEDLARQIAALAAALPADNGKLAH